MKSTVLALGLLAGIATAQEIGKPAPEIACDAWVNHDGAPPTLESLKGKTILLEFWFST